MTTPEPVDSDTRFQVLTWIGIIDQLLNTRLNQCLRDTGLPAPQFIMLNHFRHRPDEGKTVTDIARAFQQPQPGVTKTVQKLIQQGYLRTEISERDGRLKYHYLTDDGLEAHTRALTQLMPMVGTLFQGWEHTEVVVLLGLLDRLKIHLDENREP